jgi:hypothetical protein
MAAEDFFNTPNDQGLSPGLDLSSQAGNRPASGARRATPGEVLSQSFQGAQNAGDFLGLDTEFTASQDPNQPLGGSTLDLAQPPSTHDGDPASFVPEPAPMPDSDPVQDFTQAPSAFEFGEDLGSEESAGEVGEVAPSRPKGLLVGGLLAAALTAAGVYFGPQLKERFLGSEGSEAPTVARAPKPAPEESREPRQPSQPAGGEASVSTAPVEGGEVDPRQPTIEVASASTVSSKVTPKPSTKAAPAPPNVEAKTPDVAVLPSAPSGPSPRKAEFPDLAGASYEWASEDRLELIWRGTEVPMEAVHAPAKTLMPRVGEVRVFTLSGDVFAGRLYAVGQGLVWIDGEPGRIGLDGSKVERIEVLPPDPTGTPLASADALVGGRRVRVKVPGGMLYGSVLKAEGEDVMLALETGGRVRVKASEVQDLGSGRAVVVRR